MQLSRNGQRSHGAPRRGFGVVLCALVFVVAMPVAVSRADTDADQTVAPNPQARTIAVPTDATAIWKQVFAGIWRAMLKTWGRSDSLALAAGEDADAEVVDGVIEVASMELPVPEDLVDGEEEYESVPATSDPPASISSITSHSTAPVSTGSGPSTARGGFITAAASSSGGVGSGSGSLTGGSSGGGSGGGGGNAAGSSGGGGGVASSGGARPIIGGVPSSLLASAHESEVADALTPWDREAIANRIVAWQTIGGSGGDLADRRIGAHLGIKNGGWARYIERSIIPGIEWGCRRFLLHNPFGSMPYQVMQFDQLLEARDAGLTWLEADFVEAWKPVTSGAYGPVEVIAYFGTPVADADFQALYQAGDIEAWMARAWASVQPAIDAGMSIGLDMSTGADAAHPTWLFAKMLRDRGIKVYAEGVPAAGRLSHWLEMNVVLMDKYYQNIANISWAANPRDVQGELMVISPPVINEAPSRRGKLVADWLVNFLSSTPYVAAIPLYQFKDECVLDFIQDAVAVRVNAQFD